MKKVCLKTVSIFLVTAILVTILLVTSIGPVLGQPTVKFTVDSEEYADGYEYHVRTQEDNDALVAGTLPEDVTYVESYKRRMGRNSPNDGSITVSSDQAYSGSKSGKVYIPVARGITEHWVSFMRHYYYDIGPSSDEKGLWTSQAWFYLPGTSSPPPTALFILLDNWDHRPDLTHKVGGFYLDFRDNAIKLTTDDVPHDELLVIAENLPVVNNEWFYLECTIDTVNNTYAKQIVYHIPSLGYTFTYDASSHSLWTEFLVEEPCVDMVWLYAGAVDVGGNPEYILYIDFWQGIFEPSP